MGGVFFLLIHFGHTGFLLLCWLSLVMVSGVYFLVAVLGLLIAEASFVAEHCLKSTGSVVVHGFSCSETHRIFSDQGSNPLPLHRQVNSQPLDHQGSPWGFFQR